MGRSKALLPCADGEPFVARIVRVLLEGGAGRVVVVGRPRDDELAGCVQRLCPAPDYVVNADPARGQLSSLLTALAHGEPRGAGALIVHPVDVPGIAPATVAALLRGFETSGCAIVRPTHRGRHGHPVLFGAAVFEELRAADPAEGARAVVRARPGRVLDVEVADAGILRDVDTPADYRAFLDGRR